MSYNEGIVFNPAQWVKNNVTTLSDETIEQLDERYVNVGENILDQSINNLYLVNLNIATSGSIYFSHDNTLQTTAYDPNFVTNQINLFTTLDNDFTGTNTFKDLKVINSSGQTTQLIQNGNDFYFVNNVEGGSVQFQTMQVNGVTTIMVFDQFGNVSGINDVVCSRIKLSEVRINTYFRIYSNGNNMLLYNTLQSGGIQFTTTKTSSPAVTNTMLYDYNGDLSGVNNLVITTKVTTPSLNFSNTSPRIYQSGLDLILDNNVLSGNIKIKNYQSDGTMSMVMIDQFGNLSGINDIKTNRVYLGSNLVMHSVSNLIYTIKNSVIGGAIYIQNTDSTSVLRTIAIDQYMNMSGINDLYVQRLFFNGLLFDTTVVSNLINNCQMIRYSNTPNQTSIVNLTSNNEIVFYPEVTTDASYNPISKTKDNVIVSASSLSDTNALTLTSWSNTKSGFRIKSTETEAYNLKVLDGGLKFSDNTIQSTAMTSDYLTSFIQNVVNQMTIIN